MLAPRRQCLPDRFDMRLKKQHGHNHDIALSDRGTGRIKRGGVSIPFGRCMRGDTERRGLTGQLHCRPRPSATDVVVQRDQYHPEGVIGLSD